MSDAPVIVFPQNSYGTAQSSSSRPVVPGAVSLTFAAAMTDADAKNPAFKIRFTLMASWDGGLTYQSTYDNSQPPYTWNGGVSPRDGSWESPSGGWNVPLLNGVTATDVRISLDPLGSVIPLSGTVVFA